MQLQKEIEISTGHRLHTHKGGCFNLHGHNYQIKVTINYERKLKEEQNKYIEETGFYIDFSDIKKALNDNYDHQFLIYEQDPLLESLKTMPGIRVVKYIPTAENISREMSTILAHNFKNNKLSKDELTGTVTVDIYETKSSRASYTSVF